MAGTDSGAGEATYYMVKMVGSGAVCVVQREQLRLAGLGEGGEGGGGEEVEVGAACEVGEDSQPAVIIGTSSEAALSILETCIKQASSSAPLVTGSTTEPVGVAREETGGSGDGSRESWSELATLLSITKTPPGRDGNSGQKRSVPVAMETQIKRRKIEPKQTPSPVMVRSTTGPTVVPSKPIIVGGVKCGPGQRLSSGGVAKPAEKEQKLKQSREIDPPPLPSTPSRPLPSEKSDPMSQLLHEVRELRRSYSTLAGSLLIIRRNQEDIKNRLTEIGLSIVTNSSDPLILTSDPSPRRSLEAAEVTGGHLSGVERLELVPGDPEHPHTLQGINLAASFPEFDPEYLVVTRGKSCSRRNFAVNLVRYLFTPEEMAQCNCSGTRGKSRLEQERLAIVRRTTLALWPVEDKLLERGEWAKCTYSIDEACRRLNRPKVRKKEMKEDGLVLETEVESFIVGGASQL